jgi:PRC-barrel domain protein
LRRGGTAGNPQAFTERRDSTGVNAMAQPATTLDTRETEFLIGSDKVEGTNVYRSSGEKIGRIERLMIDKITGKVAYAVMSFGGFLGLGEDYYPVPWSLLTYNREIGGYDVDISDEQLKAAPKYGRNAAWDWADRTRGQQIVDYYKVRT